MHRPRIEAESHTCSFELPRSIVPTRLEISDSIALNKSLIESIKINVFFVDSLARMTKWIEDDFLNLPPGGKLSFI